MKILDFICKSFIPVIDFLFKPLGGIRKIKTEWFGCLESSEWNDIPPEGNPSQRHPRRSVH